MIPRTGRLTNLVLAAVTSATVTSAATTRAPVLERVADLPLPGAASRFDYQSIDTSADRLYLSHMGAGEMVVVDLRERRVIGVVRDLPRTTGAWAVPALGKVYASVPGHHHVAIIDARTLRVEARVGRLRFPDGIAYAPAVKKVYVSDEAGAEDVVIDGPTNRALRTIPLGGEAGNTLYDPGTGHILVAVQTRNEIVAIDPRTDRVIERHALPGSSHPHGMSIDAEARRLFVASEENATLQVVDLERWAVLERHDVGGDPDVLAYDAGAHRLYVSSESGVVSVFNESEGKLAAEGQVRLPHAHTVSVDPRTHLVYLPLQDLGGHPLLRIMAPRPPESRAR